MTTLYITRGLPASGKTTRAKAWVDEDVYTRARVNRDDLRGMLHNGYVDEERTVSAARDAAITALLRRGIDVVSDDTNLPSRTVRDLMRVAQMAGATSEIWDMTDVTPETCVQRDLARSIAGKRHVGPNVIRDMATRYLAGKFYPLPIPAIEVDAESVFPEPYVPPAGAPPAIIVDIDGTVALHGDRSPFDESRIHEDRANLPVLAAVVSMSDDGYRVIFCSGRHESCRDATREWITTRLGLDYELLLMRPDGDMRKDAIVKRELFDKHVRHNYDVRAVFDDRDQVVQMWRSLGLTVFQVAEGAF